MTVTIVPVRTRSQLSQFITLPRRLYQGMPGYVSQLDVEQREQLDPKQAPAPAHV
jgi:hypothetical protein